MLPLGWIVWVGSVPLFVKVGLFDVCSHYWFCVCIFASHPKIICFETILLDTRDWVSRALLARKGGLVSIFLGAGHIFRMVYSLGC